MKDIAVLSQELLQVRIPVSNLYYFNKGRNFRGKKLSRFSQISGKFAKVISAKNSAKADSRKFFLANKI